MTDTLALPDFLRAAPGSLRKPRAPRWHRMPERPRPEGARWEAAERWWVHVPNEMTQLASGYRRLWVITGRKWCRLHDGQDQCKVSMGDWESILKHPATRRAT